MRYIIFGIVLLVVIAGGYIAYTFITTKNHSPADTVIFQDRDFLLTIDYCRPYKKGRLIFGNDSEKPLLPYGKYWRTGANEATEIDFNQDIQVAGKLLEAGRYRLYTYPGKEEWVVVFNSGLGKWGYSEPDDAMDVLRINVSSQEADTVCEQFLISIEPVGTDAMEVNLSWDNVLVPIAISY
ncbi:MAG: DUF2911 domain-containing protein [Cyclobacteriaceae bacterium]|nr:DUF2911 domain-containing protein [Cyclobacteriaceae bacterium]